MIIKLALTVEIRLVSERHALAEGSAVFRRCEQPVLHRGNGSLRKITRTVVCTVICKHCDKLCHILRTYRQTACKAVCVAAVFSRLDRSLIDDTARNASVAVIERRKLARGYCSRVPRSIYTERGEELLVGIIGKILFKHQLKGCSGSADCIIAVFPYRCRTDSAAVIARCRCYLSECFFPCINVAQLLRVDV